MKIGAPISVINALIFMLIPLVALYFLWRITLALESIARSLENRDLDR